VNASGPSSQTTISHWIEAARRGSTSALGNLLEVCRPYLLLVANQQVAPDLQAKVGGSDLVQQTFLEAQHDFDQFRGNSEAELLAWLRQILINNAGAVSRQFRETDKREVGREVSLSDTPHAEVLNNIRDLGDSPSAWAIANEQDHALKAALNRLPEDYRQVIQWHNYERLTFEEVGRRLGRSPEAARKLWTRALDRLQQLLDPPSDRAFGHSG
jgi:RNA polymerase sigma-70 factor (ECF subfamily)